MKKGMSIVVSFYNESETIATFCETVDEYATKLEFPLEIIFVNDGSVDDSLEKVKAYRFQNIKKVQLIELSRNFGFHSAVRAGLSRVSYDICTWLGADLQEPLELLPISYSKIIDEGYEVINIERRTIKISKMQRFVSNTFSSMMRKYAIENYPRGGTNNLVLSRKVLDYLLASPEKNSDVALQTINAGFNTAYISLDYNERIAGESKWTFSKRVKLFIDSFVSFSFMPIRLVSYAGIFIFIIGTIIGVTTIIHRLMDPTVPAGYSTILCILALGFGSTDILLGIIAEYLWRTFDEARPRPAYIISKVTILNDEQ